MRDFYRGKPGKVPADSIEFRERPRTSAIQELEVIAIYNGVPIQIGLILIHRSNVSILLNLRPYTWTGADVRVGRKRLLFIRVHGSLKARIHSLLESYLHQRMTAS